MKGILKNYIVRICRHQQGNPGLLVGVVEDPEREERKSFGTFDELWKILNSDKRNKRVQLDSARKKRL